MWTVLGEVELGDVFLSLLHQVATVATLVNNVEVLGHPPGLDHLHTKLTPSLPIPDYGRRGRDAASLQRLDGLRDVSLGPLAGLHCQTSLVIFLKYRWTGRPLPSLSLRAERALSSDKMLIVNLQSFELLTADLTGYSGHPSTVWLGQGNINN